MAHGAGGCIAQSQDTACAVPLQDVIDAIILLNSYMKVMRSLIANFTNLLLFVALSAVCLADGKNERWTYTENGSKEQAVYRDVIETVKNWVLKQNISIADKETAIRRLHGIMRDKDYSYKEKTGIILIAFPEVFPEFWTRIKSMAGQGDVRSQRIVTDSYLLGFWVKKDNAEAVKWYRLAAENGDAEAQFALGICLRAGEGVKKDNAEADKWLRKAANQGHIKANALLYGLEGISK